jgi:hypothetical protein
MKIVEASVEQHFQDLRVRGLLARYDDGSGVPMQWIFTPKCDTDLTALGVRFQRVALFRTDAELYDAHYAAARLVGLPDPTGFAEWHRGATPARGWMPREGFAEVLPSASAMQPASRTDLVDALRGLVLNVRAQVGELSCDSSRYPQVARAEALLKAEEGES